MNFRPVICLLALLTFFPAEAAPVPPPAPGRVMFGVVPAEQAAENGVEVAAVAPGSPAEAAGICAGDVIRMIGGMTVSDRRALLSAVLSHNPGDAAKVELLRGGQPLTLTITFTARPQRPVPPPDTPQDATDTERKVYALSIPAEIRDRMRTLKRSIRRSLASLPGDFDPKRVSDELQQLRDLARDAQTGRPGWMVGRACDAYLQFHDARGTIVLHGVDNQLTLEVYGADGSLQLTAPLNTEEERRVLPTDLLRRLAELH